MLIVISGSYTTQVWLYKVIILGQTSETLSTSGSGTLTVSGGSVSSLATSFNHGDKTLVIRRPGVSLQQEWDIAL